MTSEVVLESRDCECRVAAPLWRLVLRRASPMTVLREGTGLPLYCVHSTGGDVAELQGFASLLGQQRVVGIQVPKEQMTAAFARTIEAISAHHVAALVAHQPEGPIRLAGWSAGAIIALEMAHRLRAMGREVPLLVAFDGAPCNSGAGLSRWHPSYIGKLVLNLPAWLRSEAGSDWSMRSVLRRIDKTLTFRYNVRLFKGDQQTLDAGPVKELLDTKGWLHGQRDFIHAMYVAMQTYVPRPYDGRVVVYESRTQPLYHLRQVGAVWRRLALDAEIVRLPSNHTGIFASPCAETMAADLLARLTTSAASCAGPSTDAEAIA